MQNFYSYWPGHASIAKILLQRNADYTASDRNGATALHYAVSNILHVMVM